MEKLYLTIDQGNSTAKMSLRSDDAVIASAVAEKVTPDAVAAFTGGRRLNGIIIASVAGYDAGLAESLRTVADNVIELTPFTPVPIGIDYTSQSTLGVDRIAAAVGACAIFPGRDIAVVDAGTAITIDYVDASGRFRGGNIAPGLDMQLQALHRFTARLPLVTAPAAPGGNPAVYGTDTPEAILSGCLMSMAGAVEYFRANAAPGANAMAVVVTGGNGPHIIPYLSHREDVVAEPHLVDNGLYRILRYNENI
ncbi:MAG: type III pantothenate kinase [Duncaniella sp.]|nr:type III pantothenate kinase [Duncaniella sp.]